MPVYNNSFATPSFIEETILDQNGNKVGTIRVKPSTVLWKPSGAQKFFSVPLDAFVTWISDPAASGSSKVKQ